MAAKGYDYLFREPLNAPAARGGKPPEYRRTVEGDILIERDLAVAMRDGVELLIDLFRPADETPAPPIIAWGPYGKHGHTRYTDVYPNCGVDQDALSHLTAFEAPDPGYWVPRGYAVINVDVRGSWYVDGTATYLSPEEAQDYYDLIEWAGTQAWSNGKVGLSGVSYLTSAQWAVAATNPPHLAAINPWEGWSDSYREVVRHGGIPETMFWGYIPGRWGHSTTKIEDLAAEAAAHPFFDAFWQSKVADFSKITVPAYVVASWSDQGMHTRGTLEGFKGMASKQKWLEVHGRKKWAYYYEAASVERQRQFFDRFLKDAPSPVDDWPAVTLEYRERCLVGAMKPENEWPIARTEYKKLFLNAATKALQSEAESTAASCRYKATGGAANRATFDVTFDVPTDLVGHMKLRLWAEADGADDMDIFVAVHKLDAAGKTVPFVFWTHFEDGPVALGWLRASHRELDEARSSAYQPVLAHQREQKMKPSEIVPLEIEIWPSGTHFEAGTKLRLILQGNDICAYPEGVMCDRHDETVNAGEHLIHAGGEYDSHLLIPVVPPKA